MTSLIREIDLMVKEQSATSDFRRYMTLSRTLTSSSTHPIIFNVTNVLGDYSKILIGNNMGVAIELKACSTVVQVEESWEVTGSFKARHATFVHPIFMIPCSPKFPIYDIYDDFDAVDLLLRDGVPTGPAMSSCPSCVSEFREASTTI